MQHITGISRQQMHFSSLEDTISPDNQVRFIDAFVEYIDLSKLDFAVKTLKTEGRPSFNSKVFMKCQYPWCSRFDCQTQKMELTLQGKSLVFTKNDVFKADYTVQFLFNEIYNLKIKPSQKALFD